MRDFEHGAEFRFRRNDTVGTADAETDDRFLSECFVDTGDLDALRDCDDPKRVIVGRTGSGKSALIRRLKEVEGNVIEIPPQNLSLSYIANSDIINFFETAGVSLDVFYQLLWRHVITVELLKYKFKIDNEVQKQSFLSNLFGGPKKDRSKEQAIAYLREWGERFWDETEYRVKELTTKVETDLKASVGVGFNGVKLDASGGKKLTEEQKQEVIQRGTKVVNEIQIKALADVIRLLSDDIFNDPQDTYFLTIDDLDDSWVAEPLRYKLIRALIETVRSFRKVKYVKIVISIRLDLLNRVIEATRDAGFQEEKYESLYLKLRWTKQQIEDLLNRRVAKLISQRYTKIRISVDDLFPARVGRTTFVDYLVERTFYRPRDAILFLNACLEQAEGKNRLTAQIVSAAEGEYSRKRLISLQEEWGATFPNLTRYSKLLLHRKSTFKVSSIDRTSVEQLYYTDFAHDLESGDRVFAAATNLVLSGNGTLLDFLRAILPVFYVVGLIGLKPDSTSGTFWSFHSNEVPSPGSLDGNSVVAIHPTFWRTLGVRVAGD
ncbi:hypothetical protein B0G81_8855 [Paraburkholderia sp. BL6665CI2N2]|nr:hypothetical protein B0G81_8855 [Paraburkholderia sp. BL6665CI2N2]